MNRVTQIDNLLPQTQCRQCNYESCLAYAEAMDDGEDINRCPPGGVKTLKALAKLLKRDVKPFLKDMLKQEKSPATAYIRETECIGCTKCIQACPVDAILGAPKQLHTVLTQECTGCGLCVAPCPVDCIDMHSLKTSTYQPKKARQRFYAKKDRLAKIKMQTTQQKKKETLNNQHAYINAAIARAKEKKSNINQSVDTKKSLL